MRPETTTATETNVNQMHFCSLFLVYTLLSPWIVKEVVYASIFCDTFLLAFFFLLTGSKKSKHEE